MIKNLILPFLLILLIIGGGWYFFIKKEDYKITFESKFPPGSIYQKLYSWNFDNTNNIENTEKKAFHHLKQLGNLNASNVELDWNIKAKNDSLSSVEIKVTHSTNLFKKRLALLFTKPDFQQKVEHDILQFKDALAADSELFSNKIIGETKSPKTTCACISLESQVNEKALKMMQNIGYLSDYILEYELVMSEKPRLYITSWNRDDNYIEFDFCFPLKNGKNAPKTPLIKIKEIPSHNSLQSIYMGNYMYSYQAWMDILNYAENEKIEIQPEFILEVFNNNPEMGGDPAQWEAEIYIPLKK